MGGKGLALIDIIAVLAGLASAWAGWQVGASIQAGGLLVVILAAIAGWYFGALCAMGVYHPDDGPNLGAVTVWTLIIFGLVWAALAYTHRQNTENGRGSDVIRTVLDRGAGAVLGLVRGLFVAYFVCAALVLDVDDGEDWGRLGDGVLGGVVTLHNPLFDRADDYLREVAGVPEDAPPAHEERWGVGL